MSNRAHRSVRSAPLFALSLMPLMMAASARAAAPPTLPTGGKVAAGTATIGQRSSSGLVISQSSS